MWEVRTLLMRKSPQGLPVPCRFFEKAHIFCRKQQFRPEQSLKRIAGVLITKKFQFVQRQSELSVMEEFLVKALRLGEVSLIQFNRQEIPGSGKMTQ